MPSLMSSVIYANEAHRIIILLETFISSATRLELSVEVHSVSTAHQRPSAFSTHSYITSSMVYEFIYSTAIHSEYSNCKLNSDFV